MLDQWIGANRCLYNIALEQRSYRRFDGSYATRLSQDKELSRLKKEFPWFGDCPSQTFQQTLKNLDTAFSRFFKKQGGFPAFKKKSRPFGIKFPAPSSIKLHDHPHKRKGIVDIPKMKGLRFWKSRQLEGTLKSATVSRAAYGEYYISFLCEIEVDEPINKMPAVGIDRGIAHTIALSSGEFFDLPVDKIKYHEEKIAFLQRQLTKKTKFSNNWKKLKNKISRRHSKTACIRRDFLWKSARTIAKSHGYIVLEDLKTKNMSKSASGTLESPGKMVAQKSGLNKAILRQGWHMFSVMLNQKAEEFGGYVDKVNPRNTSRECASCGYTHVDNRQSQDRFECQKCSHQENADINAAKVILARGLRVSAFEPLSA